MNPTCPRLYPLRVLSRKWGYLVLRALADPLTFSSLKKELHFTTNRVLSIELKLLQDESLVTNVSGAYSLTEAGRALVEAVEPLMDWSVKYKNLKYCPKEQKCSNCLHYPEQIKPHLLKMGKF